MIDRVPFTESFYDELDVVDALGERYVRFVLDNECPHSFAYRDEQGPLWAWGGIPLWDGVADMWMAVDRRASRHAAVLVSEARLVLHQYQEVTGTFVRVQGIFPVESPGLRKLAELLGFQEEGILRSHGLGGVGDYVVCARVVSCRK